MVERRSNFIKLIRKIFGGMNSEMGCKEDEGDKNTRTVRD